MKQKLKQIAYVLIVCLALTSSLSGLMLYVIQKSICNEIAQIMNIDNSYSIFMGCVSTVPIADNAPIDDLRTEKGK